MQNCTNLTLLTFFLLLIVFFHSKLKKKLKIPHCTARIFMMIYDEMSHLLLMYVTYPPIHICFNLMALKTSNKTIEFIFKSIFTTSCRSSWLRMDLLTFRLDCRGERKLHIVSIHACILIIPSISLFTIIHYCKITWSIVFLFFHEHDATDYFHSRFVNV